MNLLCLCGRVEDEAGLASRGHHDRRLLVWQNKCPEKRNACLCFTGVRGLKSRIWFRLLATVLGHNVTLGPRGLYADRHNTDFKRMTSDGAARRHACFNLNGALSFAKIHKDGTRRFHNLSYFNNGPFDISVLSLLCGPFFLVMTSPPMSIYTYFLNTGFFFARHELWEILAWYAHIMGTRTRHFVTMVIMCFTKKLARCSQQWTHWTFKKWQKLWGPAWEICPDWNILKLWNLRSIFPQDRKGSAHRREKKLPIMFWNTGWWLFLLNHFAETKSTRICRANNNPPVGHWRFVSNVLRARIT